jgi:hypothetical protein
MIARAMLARPRLLLLDGVLDQIDDLQIRGPLVKTLFASDAPWTLWSPPRGKTSGGCATVVRAPGTQAGGTPETGALSCRGRRRSSGGSIGMSTQRQPLVFPASRKVVTPDPRELRLVNTRTRSG